MNKFVIFVMVFSVIYSCVIFTLSSHNHISIDKYIQNAPTKEFIEKTIQANTKSIYLLPPSYELEICEKNLEALQEVIEIQTERIKELEK